MTKPAARANIDTGAIVSQSQTQAPARMGIVINFTLQLWFGEKKPEIVRGQVLVGCTNVLIG